jgi:hypothetical protein
MKNLAGSKSCSESRTVFSVRAFFSQLLSEKAQNVGKILICGPKPIFIERSWFLALTSKIPARIPKNLKRKRKIYKL